MQLVETIRQLPRFRLLLSKQKGPLHGSTSFQTYTMQSKFHTDKVILVNTYAMRVISCELQSAPRVSHSRNLCDSIDVLQHCSALLYFPLAFKICGFASKFRKVALRAARVRSDRQVTLKLPAISSFIYVRVCTVKLQLEFGENRWTYKPLEKTK